MASTKPVAPREDPWYKAPAGFESAKPGTILRIRTAPGDLTKIFDRSASIYNILFRTTNSHYQPSWAVSTLFVPKTTESHALLSCQLPYNSANIDASPSNLLHSVTAEFWGNVIENVQWGLSRGWNVSIPDHEGHLAAFGDGVTAGHTVLDSIRASLHAGFGMDQTKAQVALWGYSGGAFASGWAAELQGHYAPELTFAGAALGGLPPNLTNIQKVTATPFAGLIPELLLGITAQEPPAYDYLVSQLKPTHKDAFLATHHYDIAQAFMKFGGQDMFDYFSNGIEIMEHPLIRIPLMQKSTMGNHGIPQMQIYIYKSILDEITPIEHTDVLVEKWEQLGVNCLYERNTVGSHLEESENAKERVLEWLEAVLGGSYKQEGCTVRDVTTSAAAAAAAAPA